jgi:hypothetical protein
MCATEENMAFMDASSMDVVAYILVLFSLASLLFLFVMTLIHLYDRAQPRNVHGHPHNGVANSRRSRDALRDANEFELEGLVSDDEDEEAATRRKLLHREAVDDEEGSVSSPSTVGGNNERSV